MNNEDVREAFEMARAKTADYTDFLMRRFAPDGLTWDMDAMDDREFLAAYIDLGQRPSPQFTILQFLPDVSPEVFQQLTTRYERIVAKMGA